MTRATNVQPLCQVCGKVLGNPDCRACGPTCPFSNPKPGESLAMPNTMATTTTAPNPDPAVEAAREILTQLCEPHDANDIASVAGIIRRHYAAKDAEIERLKKDVEMADGCLAMVFDMLKALDQTGYDGSATPPMMYDDWLRAIVSRDRSALAAAREGLATLFARGLIVAKRGAFCSTECLSTCDDCKAIDFARRTLAKIKGATDGK